MKYKISDLLRQSFEAMSDNLHVCLPGQIETFDSATKKASVSVKIKKKFENGDSTPYPVIENVPVIFPGSADALIAFPLNQGDGCLIIFAERSIENWKLTGNLQDPSDPRKFSFSDALCIPGLFSFSSPGKVGEGQGLEILYKGAKINVGLDSLLDLANAQSDIYTLFKLIHDLLSNIVSNTNWLGNMGAPVQYLPYTADTANLVTLMAKINSLLKAH